MLKTDEGAGRGGTALIRRTKVVATLGPATGTPEGIAGGDQPGDALGRPGGGTERGDDLRATDQSRSPPSRSLVSFQHSECIALLWKTRRPGPPSKRSEDGLRAPQGARVKWISSGRIDDALQVVSRSVERQWRWAGVMHKDTHTCNPLVHDADLLLFEPLLELLEQVDGAGNARRGQSLDGAGCEAALELPGAQQYLKAMAREGHAHTAVVLRVRRGLDQPLGLKSLNERGGGCARHAQLGGDLLRAGPVRATQVDGHQRCLGAVRQAVRAERAVARPLRCRIGGDDRVGQLQGKLGAVGHVGPVARRR